MIKKFLNSLDINEEYTTPIKKKSIQFDSVKSNVPPLKHYNYMADLLHLPTTEDNYKYLLVMVDLWSNKFDIEPLKSKEAKDTLNAMKVIFTRQFLKKPHASIKTDNGTEFMSVFDKYCYDNNILHSISEPYRHKQLANVESLNKLLGRVFMGYMNTIEEKTGKVYREWTDIVDSVRTELNKLRPNNPDQNPYTYQYAIPTDKIPKYNVGDVVIHILERPKNALGHYQNTTAFRMGDYRWNYKEPKRIVKVLHYPKNIRYMLENIPNVSYTEDELKPSNQSESKYTIKAIIGKKKIKNVIHYLIHWNGYLKKDATWVSRASLLADGLKPMLDNYDNKS